MKNNEKNSNKKIAGIYYFTSLCFYIAAIINFINGDNNSIYNCLYNYEYIIKIIVRLRYSRTLR